MPLNEVDADLVQSWFDIGPENEDQGNVMLLFSRMFETFFTTDDDETIVEKLLLELRTEASPKFIFIKDVLINGDGSRQDFALERTNVAGQRSSTNFLKEKKGQKYYSYIIL